MSVCQWSLYSPFTATVTSPPLTCVCGNFSWEQQFLLIATVIVASSPLAATVASPPLTGNCRSSSSHPSSDRQCKLGPSIGNSGQPRLANILKFWFYLLSKFRQSWTKRCNFQRWLSSTQNWTKHKFKLFHFYPCLQWETSKYSLP